MAKVANPNGNPNPQMAAEAKLLGRKGKKSKKPNPFLKAAKG